MHKQLAFFLPVAALVAGGGALYYFGMAPPGRGVEVAMAAPGGALEHCVSAARIIADVHWAAACMAHGGKEADCELPDDKAAIVNAWLRDAEQRCAAGGSP